jgi:hypothetical protein
VSSQFNNITDRNSMTTNMGKNINRQGLQTIVTSIHRTKFWQISSAIAFLAILTPVAIANTSSPPTSKAANKGARVSFNGKVIALPWHRWQSSKIKRIGVADVSLMQNLGVELLDTSDRNLQPWRWFGKTSAKGTVRFSNPYRYLDITDLAKVAGWQVQISGDLLQITAPVSQIQGIQLPPTPQTPPPPPATDPLATPVVVPPQPQKYTVLLDKTAPWKLSQEKGASILTIWGNPTPEVVAKFTPAVPTTEPTISNQIEDTAPTLTPTTPQTPTLPQLSTAENQTQIRFNVPSGWQTQVTSATKPNRLTIAIAPDGFKSKDILWARGVRWRQQPLSLGKDKFAVTWLELNPKQVQIKPIWSNPTSLVATAPLGKTANVWQAVGAINAGFFNRKLLVPLGVIRRDRQWLSSPILNRGAIAWNEKGEFKIAKTNWKETIATSKGQSLAINQLNSGFVEPGIARYTAAWGTTYTPLSNNETIVIVEGDRVTNLVSGVITPPTPVPIPAKGYLLTIRGTSLPATLPQIGTQLRVDTQIIPAIFNRYPQIIGAGPVLIQNRQIVLDGLSEQFKEKFTKETALRSAIATTSSGKVLFVTVQNRAGGAGPTFTELAQLLQQMGAVDALNLDGGSSTSLYLGGELINRSPVTAARVHNAIGIFALPSR